MILTHQHFDLFEKIILERMVFIPPVKFMNSMNNEACFIYNVRGKSMVFGNEYKTYQKGGEGVLLKCGNFVQKYCNPSDQKDKQAEAIAIHFYPEVLKAIYENDIPDFIQNKSNKTGVTIERIKIDEMFEKYIESLLFYFESPSIVSDELIALKVKELILLLIKTEESGKIMNILRGLFDPIEFDFKKIIQSHLFEPLNIEDLSTLTNLSVSTFKRKFKATFNDSPARYIKRKRLENAVELLKIGSKRITDVCYDCGYNDLGHFSKLFRSHFGITPSNYREKFLN